MSKTLSCLQQTTPNEVQPIFLKCWLNKQHLLLNEEFPRVLEYPVSLNRKKQHANVTTTLPDTSMTNANEVADHRS